MKEKVVEGGGKGGLRAKQETQRGGRGTGQHERGGRRARSAEEEGNVVAVTTSMEKEIMATGLLPSTHRNRPNFIYNRVFMTLKPPDGIFLERWWSKKKLGRYTIYTQLKYALHLIYNMCKCPPRDGKTGRRLHYTQETAFNKIMQRNKNLVIKAVTEKNFVFKAVK